MIFRAKEIHEWETKAMNSNGEWVPKRPMELPSFRGRLKETWMVLRGKADVLIWD